MTGLRAENPIQPRSDATFQPSHEFGRVLAAYGGVFIVGSLLWGVVFDGFHPDRADLLGALVCLAGVGVIMYGR